MREMGGGDYMTTRTALVNAKIDLNRLIDTRGHTGILDSHILESKPKIQQAQKKIRIMRSRYEIPRNSRYMMR